VAIAVDAVAVGRAVVAIAVAGDRTFAIDAIRRDVAGTGIGRALVDVIVLLLRIGQPLANAPSPTAKPKATGATATGATTTGGCQQAL
jgi:hypothetical protein